ncbi:hypothetical protein K461DRAFT_78251 [Myriangium duriaei CBS 260.36]|uniref:Uncharacterized protein n=1 Tax=Myriangium duriaei CBS 260.36 TaxID=1168546 RepID=A0A9P4MQH5_9PEZI|nr:hypothetical protein K461DRAFT_78251 [Myriangium duriaei CBS 260.36]
MYICLSIGDDVVFHVTGVLDRPDDASVTPGGTHLRKRSIYSSRWSALERFADLRRITAARLADPAPGAVHGYATHQLSSGFHACSSGTAPIQATSSYWSSPPSARWRLSVQLPKDGGQRTSIAVVGPAYFARQIAATRESLVQYSKPGLVSVY